MKFRSLLLFACLAIVPLVAMFSHKIPRTWREAVQRAARGEGFSAGHPAVTDQPAVAPVATASSTVSAHFQPAPAPAPTLAPTPARAPTPAPISSASGPRVTPAPVATVVEDELAALGAVSIACVPLSDGGLHRCSCRVPADASGQLQRVFQASHPDPAVAWQHLLVQVRTWKREPTSQPTPRTALRQRGLPPPLAQP